MAPARARIFKLLRRTPQNRFFVRNQFRCEIDSWRHRFHVKELKISELSSAYAVCEVRTHLFAQHISNKQTIWQLSTGYEKSILASKIYILWPTRFHTLFLLNSRNCFSPHNPAKNTCIGELGIVQNKPS